MFSRKCPICGKDFESNRRDKVYCSEQCRKEYVKIYNHNYYQNNPGKYKLKEHGRNLRLKENDAKPENLKRREQKRKYAEKLKVLGVNKLSDVKVMCPYELDCFNCPEDDCIVD